MDATSLREGTVITVLSKSIGEPSESIELSNGNTSMTLRSMSGGDVHQEGDNILPSLGLDIGKESQAASLTAEMEMTGMSMPTRLEQRRDKAAVREPAKTMFMMAQSIFRQMQVQRIEPPLEFTKGTWEDFMCSMSMTALTLNWDVQWDDKEAFLDRLWGCPPPPGRMEYEWASFMDYVKAIAWETEDTEDRVALQRYHNADM
ncbi:hypothetical protein L208DRAFT_1378546 [Tricholoma matsutake]|nr:hypothetical protein L208DRAFT_1378546 [Tricholoma matsutake 945]